MAATVSHIVGGDPATLVWMANQNCITPHTWSARIDRPDRPDRLIFDLDPPGDEAFEIVRDAALALGELLRGYGLTPFAMVTGSKGVHVVAPLRRSDRGRRARAGAASSVQELADGDPDRLTTAWRKEKRGGRVLVDTARNTYAQTVVAPYAVRALPGAPVAVPLAWEELEDPELRAPSAGRCARSPTASATWAIPGRASAATRRSCRRRSPAHDLLRG